MHPPDCPFFEYENHPNKVAALKNANKRILLNLRRNEPDIASATSDTRPTHHLLFSALCTPGFEYFAGHYRGETFRCLQYLQVRIPSDARVGVPPDAVATWIDQLGTAIRASLIALDQARVNSTLPVDKLYYIVVFGCRVFVQFLTIHPYANGNGHLARFCLLAILIRYGYAIQNWAIDPRPNDPPYSTLIADYRSGQKEPLEKYILSMVVRLSDSSQ